MSTIDLAAAAESYAARGWHVFPCRPRGKTPITAHGVKDATTDLAQIRAWWNAEPAANVGIAAGASGLVVIDLDGPEGADSYGILLTEHGSPGTTRCPDGASVATGRGYHMYFTAPDEIEVTPRAGVRPGLDVRAGASYVVAPPGIHPSGATYRWLDAPPAGGLPTLSEAWCEVLRGRDDDAPVPVVRVPPIRDGAHGTGYGRAALAGVLRELAGITRGRRNHATYSAARRVLDLHDAGHLPDVDRALALVAEVAGRIGLGHAEIGTTIASALAGARGDTTNNHKQRVRSLVGAPQEVAAHGA